MRLILKRLIEDNNFDNFWTRTISSHSREHSPLNLVRCVDCVETAYGLRYVKNPIYDVSSDKDEGVSLICKI